MRYAAHRQEREPAAHVWKGNTKAVWDFPPKPKHMRWVTYQRLPSDDRLDPRQEKSHQHADAENDANGSAETPWDVPTHYFVQHHNRNKSLNKRGDGCRVRRARQDHSITEPSDQLIDTLNSVLKTNDAGLWSHYRRDHVHSGEMKTSA